MAMCVMVKRDVGNECDRRGMIRCSWGLGM